MHNRLFALALAASMFAGFPARPSIAAAPGEGDEAKAADDGVALAKAAFARGVALYERGEVAEALAQFETAYGAAPDYRVLYNIGVAQSRLRRDLDALSTFARYVAEGGNALSAERRASVEANVVELEARVCRVQIEASTEGASVSTDGDAVGSTPLQGPVYLAPGHHELVVSIPDHVPFRRTVQARAGERLVIVVPALEPVAEAPIEATPPEPKPPLVSTMDDPSPAPRAKPKLRVATWALVGVTSAATVATATLAGLSYAQRRRFDAALDTYPSPDVGATRDRLRNLALATDVLDRLHRVGRCRSSSVSSIDCAEAQSGVDGLRCAEGWCIDQGGESSSEDGGSGICDEKVEGLEGSVGVFSATSSDLIEGAIVDLCRGLDTECAQPVFTSTTGADGVAPLMVPPDFIGYVQVRAEGYIPQLLLGPPPLIDGNPMVGGLDIESPFETPGMLLFPLVRPGEAAGLALLLGTDYDETRGVVSGNARGCYGSMDRRLGLVALTDLTGATPWCLVDGLPSRTADTLDEACGYLNAPPGLYSVQLIDRDDGLILEEASVIVRAGAFTTVRFR